MVEVIAGMVLAVLVHVHGQAVAGFRADVLAAIEAAQDSVVEEDTDAPVTVVTVVTSRDTDEGHSRVVECHARGQDPAHFQ